MLVEANLKTVSEKIMELQRIKEALLIMFGDCQGCCPSAKASDCTIVASLFIDKNADKN